MPPPAELRNRPQDGISWIQEGTAVGLGFLLRLWSIGGAVGYLGGRGKAGGGPGGHTAGGAPRGAPSTLVPASLMPWRRVQVSWITFGEKITFPKVSFRLDSV